MLWADSMEQPIMIYLFSRTEFAVSELAYETVKKCTVDHAFLLQ